MAEYEKAYVAALAILKKLTPDEREWIQQATICDNEERAFRDAYHTLREEDWKEPADVIFILTEDDAQIVAQDMIGRSLTEDELHDVSKGVEAGLDEWGMIMRVAINGVTGEGDGLW